MVAKSQLTQIASKPSVENSACCLCSAHPCLCVLAFFLCVVTVNPSWLHAENPVPRLICGIRYICFYNCLICVLWPSQVAKSFLPKFYLLLQPYERLTCCVKLPWDYEELHYTVTHEASLCRCWHTTVARSVALLKSKTLFPIIGDWI